MIDKAAVLTGDVVNSGKLEAAELDRLFEVLAAGVDAIKTWPGADASIGLERSRGDGWQALISEPKWALRACLVLRARLIAEGAGFDTRIAVGIGSVSNLSPDGLEASDGEAFRRSGRALDGLKGTRRFAVDIEGASEDVAALAGAVFDLCDAFVGEWTAGQAEVLALALAPNQPTQTEIADALGGTQQAVQKHFNRGYGAVLRDSLVGVERALEAK